MSRIMAARENRSADDWEAWDECQVGRVVEGVDGGGVIREELVEDNDDEEAEDLSDGIGKRLRGLLDHRGLLCFGELVEVEFVDA
jgi:hypothetical protein